MLIVVLSLCVNIITITYNIHLYNIIILFLCTQDQNCHIHHIAVFFSNSNKKYKSYLHITKCVHLIH